MNSQLCLPWVSHQPALYGKLHASPVRSQLLPLPTAAASPPAGFVGSGTAGPATSAAPVPEAKSCATGLLTKSVQTDQILLSVPSTWMITEEQKVYIWSDKWADKGHPCDVAVHTVTQAALWHPSRHRSPTLRRDWIIGNRQMNYFSPEDWDRLLALLPALTSRHGRM